MTKRDHILCELTDRSARRRGEAAGAARAQDSALETILNAIERSSETIALASERALDAIVLAGAWSFLIHS